MKKNTYSKEFIIGDTAYRFARRAVPQLPISMILPINITIMDINSVKEKYPVENRPDIALTLPHDETINFLYTLTDKPTSNSDILEILKNFKKVIKHLQFGSTFYESDLIQAEISPIGWLDYKNTVLGKAVYNIMYLLNLEGKLLICSFCCPYKDRQDWKPLVLEMIKKIRYIEKK